MTGQAATMPVEHVVHKMTQDTALVYGMYDRGVLAPGYRADVNVIDYDGLRLHDPQMVYDLPGGRQADHPARQRLPC